MLQLIQHLVDALLREALQTDPCESRTPQPRARGQPARALCRWNALVGSDAAAPTAEQMATYNTWGHEGMTERCYSFGGPNCPRNGTPCCGENIKLSWQGDHTGAEMAEDAAACVRPFCAY